MTLEEEFPNLNMFHIFQLRVQPMGGKEQKGAARCQQKTNGCGSNQHPENRSPSQSHLKL